MKRSFLKARFDAPLYADGLARGAGAESADAPAYTVSKTRLWASAALFATGGAALGGALTARGLNMEGKGIVAGIGGAALIMGGVVFTSPDAE